MKTKKLKTNLIIFSVLFCFFGAITTHAINTSSSGWKLGKSGSNADINVHGNCKKISGSGSEDYFVPTKTSSEWLNFLKYMPSSLKAEDCSTAPSKIQIAYNNEWWKSYCPNMNHGFVTVYQNKDHERPICDYPNHNYFHQHTYRLEGSELYFWNENSGYSHPHKLGDHKNSYRNAGKLFIVDLKNMKNGGKLYQYQVPSWSNGKKSTTDYFTIKW